MAGANANYRKALDEADRAWQAFREVARGDRRGWTADDYAHMLTIWSQFLVRVSKLFALEEDV